MELRCPFDKVLLGGFHRCANSSRAMEGEQIAVFCTSPPASQNCHDLVRSLRERAAFAIRQRSAGAPLPFGKDLKVLLGGLHGLHRTQFPDADDGSNTDIHELVSMVCARYDSVDSLPFDEIVRSIAACKPRSLMKKKPPL